MFLALGSLAHALTCHEIVSMVNVGVPKAIVVQTVLESDAESVDIGCLLLSPVPEEVIAAAQQASITSAPADDLTTTTTIPTLRLRLTGVERLRQSCADISRLVDSVSDSHPDYEAMLDREAHCYHSLKMIEDALPSP